jgi:hypothetical protein
LKYQHIIPRTPHCKMVRGLHHVVH